MATLSGAAVIGVDAGQALRQRGLPDAGAIVDFEFGHKTVGGDVLDAGHGLLRENAEGSNLVWPQWTPADAVAQAEVRAALLSRDEQALTELHGRLSACYMVRRPLPKRFTYVLMLPEFGKEPIGLPALERLAAGSLCVRRRQQGSWHPASDAGRRGCRPSGASPAQDCL